MAAELFIPPSKALDANANPYAGAKWFFYATGTTTPQTTYTTAARNVAHANPVVADSSGKFANIFFDTALVYRGVLKSADESVILHDIDPVSSGVLAALGESTGAGSVGTSQAETGAVNVSLQTLVRKYLPVYPEQFGAVGDGTTDDTIALQRAIDAAGNWASANYARVVVLTRIYKTTDTLDLRPYVSIHGIGKVRSGIKPTLTSGPAIDADSFATGSDATGFSHQSLRDFGIDGTNCTGSAYAIRIRGQTNSAVSGMSFNNFLTTQHAVQIVHNGYGISFDGCWFRNNNRFLKISREDVSGNVSFPTTIVFRGCNFEEGPNTADEEAILLSDCTHILFTDRCIFQSLSNRTTIKIEGTANRSTTHEHGIIGCWFEDNGNNHASHVTIKIVGVSANRVDFCKIADNAFHGFGGGGGHISMTYTRGLVVEGSNSVSSTQKWITDGGNNDYYDIDPMTKGTCDLQSAKYSLTTLMFDSTGAVTYRDGQQPLTVSRQAVGVWYVDTARAFTGSASIVATVEAFDGSGNPMQASCFASSTTRIEVRTFDAGTGATATDPSRVKLTVLGNLVAYS